MAGFSTTNILPASATFLDLSENGRWLSYKQASGSTDTLYVVDLSNQITYNIASAPISATGAGYFDSNTGVDGGQLSSDGRYILYTTGQTNGQVAPNGGGNRLFMQDLRSGTPAVDITPTIPVANVTTLAGFWAEDISDDGHRVVYGASYQLLGGPHSEDFKGLVVLDTTSGAETRFSTILQHGSLTPDGNYLSYSNGSQLSVTNVQTGTTNSYSSTTTGAVSADGRYTVYENYYSGQVFIHDRNQTSLFDQIVSSSADGTVGNGPSHLIALSGDGRHVVFTSDASNLVSGDTNGRSDLFIKDIDSGAVRMLPSNSGTFKDISFDGTRLIFESGSGISISQLLPPTLTINRVSNDGYVNAAEGNVVTVSGTSDAIGSMVIITGLGGPLFAGALVQANGTWSTTVNIGSLGDGTANVHASVSDNFHLTSSADRSFIVDRTPPTANIISVAGDDIINAEELMHVTMTGSVLFTNPTGPGTETGTIIIGIQGALVSGFPAVANAAVVPYNFTHSLNAAGLQDGIHTAYIIATDHAGNKVTVTRQIAIDTTPPVVAITSVSDDDVVSPGESGTPQAVHGTSDAIGRTVTILLDGVEVDAAVVQADGTWLSMVDFSSSVTGNHTITAQVSDLAGNVGHGDYDVLVDRGFSFQRLSVGPNGEQGSGDGYVLFPSLSADATKLVFTGVDFHLTATATGSFAAQVYVKDLVTGAISFVTPDPSMNSQFGSISPDGTKVVFVSNEELDPTEFPWITHGEFDYYTYVTNLSDGIPHIKVFDSKVPDAFSLGLNLAHSLRLYPLSIANNGDASIMLMSGDVDPSGYVLLNTIFAIGDNVNGLTPQTPVGGFGYFQSSDPLISADGTVVAFQGTNNIQRYVQFGTIFPEDNQIYAGAWSNGQQTIALVSSNPDGTPMAGGATDPALSADGKFVAFWARDDVLGRQVFVKNLQTGELRVASSDAAGNPGTDHVDVFRGGPHSIVMSADGRYVAFTSGAHLTPDDNNPEIQDIFIKDMTTGAILRLPLPDDTGGPGASTQLAMSADGQYIVFVTDKALAGDDTNGTSDVYGISLAALGSALNVSINAVTGDDRVGAAEISNQLAITGTSDAIGETVTLTLDGVALAGVVVGANGTWSTTINAVALGDGTHRLQARVSDGQNSGADGDVFTIDRTAPTVTLTSDKATLAPGETATITATFSEGISTLSPNFFSVSGGSIGSITFLDDHTLTGVFTPNTSASIFTIKATPGATDFAGNFNTGASLTVGLAFDGYLSGSFVFMDANDNGVYDDGEASTTTDANGHFLLSGGSGPLVLQGGFDVGTQLPFNGVLSAPEGFATISPLTTLAAYVQRETGGDTNAMLQLVSALAHAGNLGDLHDIVAEAGLGNADAQSYLLSCIQLADAASLMSSALSGASGVSYAEVYDDVMHALAHAIVTNGSATDLLQQVVSIMTQLGQTYGLDPAIAQNVIDTTNTILQSIAAATADIPLGSDGDAFLSKLYAIARLAQGAASDVVGSPDAQSDDPFNAVTAPFSGDALQGAIDAATPLAVTPISLSALDIAYIQNFNSLANSGQSALTLPGWLIHESGASARNDGQYLADNGADPAGDAYSYGSVGATDRALGTLQAGTLIPSFGAVFVNDTGETITSLDIAYIGEQWRLGNPGRSDGLTFEYSLDATDLTNGTWISFHGLDFATPNTSATAGATDGNAPGYSTSVAATITGLNIANGANVFIRWTDTNANGADDGLAIDDLSITPRSGDTTRPTVTVEQAGGQGDPVTAGPVNFLVTFSEEVSGFDASDIDLSASTVGGTLVATVSAGPTPNSYAVSVTGMSGTGTVAVSVPAGAAVDASNNQSLASTSVDNSVTFGLSDTAAPSVTINQAAGQADPAGGNFVVFTVTFSEDVTDFTADDIDLSASTVGGTLSVNLVAGATLRDYTVIVSGMTGSGDVIASIAAGAVTDAAGNPNTASTSTDNSITFVAGSDTTPPDVTIEQASGQADPTSTDPVTFTVTFTEPVTGFNANDIDLSASTVGGTLVATVTGGPSVYTVSVTGMTGDGAVIAKVPAGAAIDAANNASHASTSADNSINFVSNSDTTPPDVTIEQASGQADPTSTDPVTFTVTFTEPVTGFNASDIDLSASTVGGTLVATVTGGPSVYTVSVTGMTGNGAVIAKVPAGAAIDAANNASHASTSTDNSINFVAPGTAVVNQLVASGTGITAGSGILNAGHEIILSLKMSTLIMVAGGTPTLALNDGGVATYVGGSGTAELTFKYTVAVGENTADLAVTGIDLHGATLRDAQGHDANMAGAIANPAGTLQIDTLAPAARAISLTQDTGSSSSDHVTSNPALTVAAAENGSVLLYKVDAGAFSTTAPTFATNGTADGVHTVQVEQRDAAGNIGPATSLTFTLDTRGPTLDGISVTPAGGSNFAGSHIKFTLDFNEAATVSGGTPTLLLSNGATAVYDAAASALLGDSSKFVFDYLVSASDHAASSLSIVGLNPHGAHFDDLAGNRADLSHVTAVFDHLQINETTIAATNIGGFIRPELHFNTAGQIIMDAPTQAAANAYGIMFLYIGLPASTPYPPVSDFHLV